MPVDLVGALVGWVVSLVGDAGVRLVRRSPDERALSKAMGLAIDRVVEQADSSSQEGLRVGLKECFSAPPRLRLDATTSVGEGLRGDTNLAPRHRELHRPPPRIAAVDADSDRSGGHRGCGGDPCDRRDGRCRQDRVRCARELVTISV